MITNNRIQLKGNFLSVIFLFAVFFVSCKKDGSAGDAPATPPTGVPTPVGTETGGPTVQKAIGAQGGTIATADARISVNIPAGALETEQQFSIKPITNQTPLGIGTAYRLEPHDVEFKKPVSITFSYEDEDIPNSIPEALGIAYQDVDRIWQAQGGAVLNKTQRTIKINTTHFSDWSLFESIYMTTSATMLPVGATAELEVFSIEDLIIPLTEGSEVPMGKKVSAAKKYIKEWKLAGAGRLTHNGATATYKAPSTVPGAPNPVAISVSLDLKARGTFLLVQHIEIVSDDGEIEVQVAGSTLVKKLASISVKKDGYHYIADSDGDTEGSYVFMMVPAQLGTHAYRNPFATSGTYFHYLITGGNNYVCQYVVDDEVVASGGGITLTDLGDQDGFIKGTFSVSPAGFGDQLKNTVNITGKFRVRKAK